MRHFHLTRNMNWRPIINVDKLLTLVPAPEREAGDDLVPVVDTLRAGYGKVLGSGKCVVCVVLRSCVCCLLKLRYSAGCPLSLSSSRHDSCQKRQSKSCFVRRVPAPTYIL